MKVMAGGVSRVQRGDRLYGANPQALEQAAQPAGGPRGRDQVGAQERSRSTPPIVCMTDHDQLDENLRAMAEPYTEKDEKLLTAQLAGIGPSYCRMCGSCGGVCEKGVPVPDVLRFLTYAEGYGQFALAREHFLGMPQGGQGRPLQRLHVLLVPLRLRRGVPRRAHARTADAGLTWPRR